MNEFKKNIFKKSTSDSVTPPPIITNSNISFSSPTVYQSNAGDPYPDGGGIFSYEIGQCDVVFNVEGANISTGDILTIRFQSFSSFATRQCCLVQYAGTVNPASQIIPITGTVDMDIIGTVDIDITYNGINNTAQVMLFTPTEVLQPTSSASSSMTLVKINGNDVTFPSSTDSAILVTPSDGSVTLTLI